ncbi:MAG TPA: winged helix DNA-binding domain-containing protein [Propionicimonas sp.]
MDRTDVLQARLATQRLSGPPAANPIQAVSELLCVQSQDAPIARAMIAQRCEAGTEAGVLAAIAAGDIVRTHVLRPTWHYVAAADLRWLLQLTSPKVESGMGSRHRQLSLVEPRVSAALEVIATRLEGRQFANRTVLGATLADAGLLAPEDPLFGQQVGHVLLLAELRGQICSAPLDLAEHRYALVEEVVPAAQERSREEAVTELVSRFVAGHGPVALSDLMRWAKVTLGEARAAVAGLGDSVERLVVDGEELWHSPASALPTTRAQDAWLVSTFDEVLLSYRKVPWPRSAGHPLGDDPSWFSESGGGVVISGLEDVGAWKRVRGRGEARIRLSVDETLSRAARNGIDAAVERLLSIID